MWLIGNATRKADFLNRFPLPSPFRQQRRQEVSNMTQSIKTISDDILNLCDCLSNDGVSKEVIQIVNDILYDPKDDRNSPGLLQMTYTELMKDDTPDKDKITLIRGMLKILGMIASNKCKSATGMNSITSDLRNKANKLKQLFAKQGRPIEYTDNVLNMIEKTVKDRRKKGLKENDVWDFSIKFPGSRWDSIRHRVYKLLPHLKKKSS